MAEKKKKVRWFWEKEPDEAHGDMLEPLGFPKSMRMILAGVPVDVSETDKELVVRAQLPGFKKDEIKLVITDNTFELSAEKKHEVMERGETFYRKEMSSRSVHRSFALPSAVDPNKVSAKLEEGVLTVTMPKLESEKKKKKAVEIE